MTPTYESITTISEEISSRIQKEFEAWYQEEEKRMPPFDEYTKKALEAFSKLAYVTGYTNASDYIANKLGV